MRALAALLEAATRLPTTLSLSAPLPPLPSPSARPHRWCFLYTMSVTSASALPCLALPCLALPCPPYCAALSLCLLRWQGLASSDTVCPHHAACDICCHGMHGAATRLRGQELKLSHFALSTAKRYPSHLNTNKIWQCSLVAGVLATST